VKMEVSGPREACQKAHRRPTGGWEGLRLSIELPDLELGPCKGILVRVRGMSGPYFRVHCASRIIS
jgi:hypothetical protein